MRSTRTWLGALIAVLVVLVGCLPASQRFAQLDGPFAPNVVYPDEFGVDVSDLSVPVPPLLRAVSSTRLRAHVDAIDVPRPGASAQAIATADYIEAQLDGLGYTVQRQTVPSGSATMPNVFADKPGLVPTGIRATCPEKLFVVGAHYDTVDSTPGADDNASGVAGLLELAQVLRDTGLPISVRFTAFAFEENGLIGSRVMAQDLRARNVDVAGMVSLDQIGFTVTTEDQFLGTTNDYLGVAANPPSDYLARVFGAAAFHYLPLFFAPSVVVDPAVLPDVRRSDNASFWDAGYQALLITDTGPFRSPHYHSVSDTIDTLNFGFVRSSVRSTLAGLVAFATVDANNDGRPDVCED